MNRNKNPGSPRFLNELKEQIKAVNYVLEVLDARAPQSSSNPYIRKITGVKQNILILNKTDLAQKNITLQWLEYYKKQGYKALSFNTGQPASLIFNQLELFNAKPQNERFKRPCRIMVAGTPNVGKSTIINTLLRRKAARTGDRSGITRGRQWIRLKPGLELLDTAGVLPPFINEETRKKLAALGVLPVTQWDPPEIAAWLIDEIRPAGLIDSMEKRYAKKGPDVKKDTESFLRIIGEKRGCLRSGGEADLYQASEIFLKEFRDGQLGGFSLEKPSDYHND